MLAAGVSLGKTEAEVKFNERETAALQAVLIAALEARLLAGLLSLLLLSASTNGHHFAQSFDGFVDAA